jgi:N-acetylneuraminic acid mutarotase
MYVFGGSHMGELRSAEKYMFPDDVWDILPEMPVPVSLAFSTTYNDAIYITGGMINKILAFDPFQSTYRKTEIETGFG